jgi:hypothetical protein
MESFLKVSALGLGDELGHSRRFDLSGAREHPLPATDHVRLHEPKLVLPFHGLMIYHSIALLARNKDTQPSAKRVSRHP